MGSDTDTRWERDGRTIGRLLLVVAVTAAVATVPVAASVAGGGQAAGTDGSRQGDVEFVNCTTMRVSDDVDEVAISYLDVEAEYDATVWVRTNGDSTVDVPFLGLPSIALLGYDGDADGTARDPIVYGGEAPPFRDQCVATAKRTADPTAIRYGATKTASVSSPDPNDSVTFWGERGDVVTVEMRSANLDVAAENVPSDEGVRDPTLVLEGPDGQILARATGGDGDDARIFTFPLSENGEYTIVAAEGATSTLTSSESRNYELSLSLVGGTSDANSDGDSVVDAQEEYFGTDPTDRDTDGDGYWDGHELNRGTDPTDPESHPSVASPTSATQNDSDASTAQTGDSGSPTTETPTEVTTTATPESQSAETRNSTQTRTSTAGTPETRTQNSTADTTEARTRNSTADTTETATQTRTETRTGGGTAAPETRNTDGDSLSDARERTIGTDPTDRDTDGDGYWDGHEVDVGTDPLDPEDHPDSEGDA